MIIPRFALFTVIKAIAIIKYQQHHHASHLASQGSNHGSGDFFQEIFFQKNYLSLSLMLSC